MGRIVAIGDIHSHVGWMEIAAIEECDKFIFLGDYVDTFRPIPPEKEAENLERIIEFKQSQLDKVVLLIGNHDWQYMGGTGCSGWSQGVDRLCSPLFKKGLEEGLFEVVHQEDKYLFSHAGLTKTWMKNKGINSVNEVNHLLYREDNGAFDFISGGLRTSPYGDNIWQGPLWVRPQSLMDDMWKPELIQIVGHTHVKEITHKTDGDKQIYLVDSLPTDYLVIENGEIIIKKLR